MSFIFFRSFTMANSTKRLIHFSKSYINTRYQVRKGASALIFARYYSSALFVSGRNANKTYSFLSPYINFDSRIANIDKLQQDLVLRGLKIDINQLKETWYLYKSMSKDKYALEENLQILMSQLKALHSKNVKTSEEERELAKLQMQCKVVKQDYRCLKEALWDMDESFIPLLLQLPNALEENIPTQSPVVLKSIGNIKEVSEKDWKSHIEIGKKLGLLEYRNPVDCYLCNEAALFELGALSYAGEVLSENNMLRVAGADFSRSSVVEGSGLNHKDPAEAFILNNHTDVKNDSVNRMHLVGGATLISFLALHAKQIINPKNFPLRYFATGRQYTPFPNGAAQIGLFTVCQASVAHIFTMVKNDSNEYKEQFDNLIETVCKLYDNICDHYQVVMRSAPELRPWESMRVSFELWSPFTKQYVEVGHISKCGIYFSERLVIGYQTPTGKDFPFVISGTVLSVPRLLGCLLEQNADKFVIPEKIAKHMPIGMYRSSEVTNTPDEGMNKL